MKNHAHFIIAGKFTSRAEWIHPTITVPTTEIIIMTDGVAYIEEDGEQYALSPCSVLLLSPNTEHRGYAPSADRVSFYWIHAENFDLHADGAPSKHFTLREPHHVSILCRQLMHYKSHGADAEITDALLQVLIHELAVQSYADDSSESALVERIREWIRINSDRNITTADVTAKFGYNEDYISRLCKQYSGGGFKSLVVESKIGLIEKFLLETNLTLAEIADATGFSDYKLFLKFFKYHTDMTPSDFRHVYYAMHTNNK